MTGDQHLVDHLLHYVGCRAVVIRKHDQRISRIEVDIEFGIDAPAVTAVLRDAADYMDDWIGGLAEQGVLG